MKLYFFIILLFICPILVFSQEFPSVRYIISKDGLNKKEYPSNESKNLGSLFYGSRVIIYEKSNNIDTINGIKDYWYKCSYGGSFWVFGAYLSKEIPEDTEPVVGYWNTDSGEKYYWNFKPDNTVSFGTKETDVGWIGTWTLSEYIGEPPFRLSFAEKKIYNLLIVNKFTKGESQAIKIILHIINRNRIYFQYENGNGEFLDLNNNIY